MLLSDALSMIVRLLSRHERVCGRAVVCWTSGLTCMCCSCPSTCAAPFKTAVAALALVLQTARTSRVCPSTLPSTATACSRAPHRLTPVTPLSLLQTLDKTLKPAAHQDVVTAVPVCSSGARDGFLHQVNVEKSHAHLGHAVSDRPNTSAILPRSCGMSLEFQDLPRPDQGMILGHLQTGFDEVTCPTQG